MVEAQLDVEIPRLRLGELRDRERAVAPRAGFGSRHRGLRALPFEGAVKAVLELAAVEPHSAAARTDVDRDLAEMNAPHPERASGATDRRIMRLLSALGGMGFVDFRSEEHTSELQ